MIGPLAEKAITEGKLTAEKWKQYEYEDPATFVTATSNLVDCYPVKTRHENANGLTYMKLSSKKGMGIVFVATMYGKLEVRAKAEGYQRLSEILTGYKQGETSGLETLKAVPDFPITLVE